MGCPYRSERAIESDRSARSKPGRTSLLTGGAFESDSENVGDDDRDGLLGALGEEELTVELHRLELLESQAGAVVGNVKGDIRAVGKPVSGLFVELGLSGLEDCLDLFSGHGGENV
jgi:hypothetical protein